MSLSILPTVPTQDLTITDDGHQFFLTVLIQAASAPCPQCGQVSSRFDSTYSRQVHDLPWSWWSRNGGVTILIVRNAFSVCG